MTIKTCPAPMSVELENTKETFCFRLINKNENDFIQHMLVDMNAYIAGGFAVHHLSMGTENKLPFGDIDIYFHTEEDYLKALEHVKFITGFTEAALNTKPYLGESIRASTFRLGSNTYQLIKATFGSVEQTFSTFDFTNAKVALRINRTPELFPQKLELVFDELVPSLFAARQAKYTQQTHLNFPTIEEKRVHAKSNLGRLEKYLERFPGGLYNEESREHILLQYAWNLKYQPNCNPEFLPHLKNLLTSATQEELILFFPLGGVWKKAFDTNGKSLLLVPRKTISSWDNPKLY